MRLLRRWAKDLNAAALVLARELRRAGLRIELGEGSFRLKKSFEAADKTARRIVILGEDELQSGILTVKNFATGIQTKVPRAELAAFLRDECRLRLWFPTSLKDQTGAPCANSRE